MRGWFFTSSPTRADECRRQNCGPHIRGDPPDPIIKASWLELLRYRQTWAFVAGMSLTGPAWWFYLFWIPDFLHKQHGLNLVQLGPPLVVIYLMTDVGSVAGGWLSSRLIKLGWSVNAGRKTAMLACACCVPPVFFTAWITHLWVATIIIGAPLRHQGLAANLFTWCRTRAVLARRLDRRHGRDGGGGGRDVCRQVCRLRAGMDAQFRADVRDGLGRLPRPRASTGCCHRRLRLARANSN